MNKYILIEMPDPNENRRHVKLEVLDPGTLRLSFGFSRVRICIRTDGTTDSSLTYASDTLITPRECEILQGASQWSGGNA
jgi:hypothetical protein